MDITRLRRVIKSKVPSEYNFKVNFTKADFLVEIGNLIIKAKTVCDETEVKYEFVLDTQFLSQDEITYDELVMVKEIIEVLEANKELAISKLGKWTVEKYKEDIRLREERSAQMLEALKKAFCAKEK